MPTVNIYNTTLRGSLVMTGNTMIIFPEGSNYTNPLPPPPSGSIVNNYRNNGSSATITIPNTAIMYNAKLLWAGVTGTGGGIVIPDALNNAPVTLTVPSGESYAISQNPAWKQTFTITGNAKAYVNIADITDLVSTVPNGFYTVRGLPTLAQFFGGWMLYITYKDSNEPFRNINIWSLLSQINAGQPPVDISVSGFRTPVSGNVTGRMILAAGNGQPQLSGENILFGPTTSSLVTLSGPNNPINNFFQSQINGNDGLLNTLGTFGNNNTPLGQSPSNGQRTLWDITRVDASPGLTTNQTSAIIRTTTAFDSYWISSVGLQVDVNAANLSPIIKSTDKAFADVGDTLNYKIAFENSGLVESFNTVLIDTLPNGVAFSTGTVFINDVQFPNFNPQTGIFVGTVAAGARITVTFSATVTTIPTPNPANNVGEVSFSYSNSSGTGTVSDTTASNMVSTYVNHSDIGCTKQVNKVYGTVGDVLTYTIPVNIIGNTTAVNVVFLDTIPNGTSFIPNSFTQNGVTIPSANPSSGVALGNIGPSKTSTIVFKVIVNTIPSPNPLVNSATVFFTYTINPVSIPNRTASSGNSTNTVSTQINYATLNSATKTVSKSYADCNETFTYFIVATNNGNVTAQNVIFKDTIPNGTIFINDSVIINNIPSPGAFPSSGITLPNIPPLATVTLSFDVRVNCE